MSYIKTEQLDRELKKGSAELLILSLLEARARHGYELRKLIETRSQGVLKFNTASLYPLLQAIEQRIERRRRFYKLKKEGRKVLAAQRTIWESFVAAINRVTRPQSA